MKLIEAAPDDAALAYVAAGELENLFRYHGDEVVHLVEAQYARSARLRKALTGVWLGPDEADAWAPVLSLMAENPPEERLS